MHDFTSIENEYRSIRPQYEIAAKHVQELLWGCTVDFKIHDINYRAKKVESFIEKCKKTYADGSYKYDTPFHQIRDFAGVRLICFLKKDVDPICETILSRFDSDDVEDVGERIFKKGRFGYQSKHILVRLPKDTYLPNCRSVDDVFCEIQVRTLLQHAWAEIEHDIQYKGEFVPDALRKRFVSLAGLLEIADGELERIQRDSDELIEGVREDFVSELTEEVLEAQEPDASEDPQFSSRTKVRDLVAQGRYHEALEIYDEKLADPSPSHTLYIGRAKVKFLLGNTESALTDLRSAEEINSTDPTIFNLRDLIHDGSVDYARPKKKTDLHVESNSEVFQLMLEGKGKEGFALISRLEENGYNKAFAIINKAACCLLELDTIGTQEYLSKLRVNIGSPMSVNIHLLRYILAVVSDENPTEELNELMIVTSAVPHYKITQSHMLNFLSGFKLRHRATFSTIQKALKTVPQLRIPAK